MIHIKEQYFVPTAVILLLLCLCSCSEKQRESELKNKGLVLNPGPLKTSLIYVFSNFAERDILPQQKEASIAVLKLAQTWSSNCSGEIKLIWQGFDLEKNSAQFDYTLSNLKFLEGDHYTQLGRTWTEQYGGEPSVQMKEQGVSRNDAMGEMRGDPRQYYLSAKSQAYFSSHGEALRENGQLNPAAYFKESADIGQYFLGGFKVEELAHRLICPLPIKLEDQFKWNFPVTRWVDAPPTEKALVEHWSCLKVESGWVLKCEISDRLERTSVSGLTYPVMDWIWKRTIKAWIDPLDLMPLEIEWQDEVSWGDKIQNVKDEKTGASTLLIHRWKNVFKARRS